MSGSKSFLEIYKKTAISKPMDVNTSAIVETMGISQTTQKAMDLDGTQTCVDLIDITKDGEPAKHCLEDPEQCEFGISVSMWVKFKNRNIFTKETFLSTGGVNLGLKFELVNGVLYVTIRGKTKIWQASKEYIKTQASTEKFNLFGFMWSKVNNSIRIMINDTVYESTATPKTATALDKGKILKLGCIDGTNYLAASVLTPSLWLWYVCDKQLLMGKTVHDLARQDAGTTVPPPTTLPQVQTDYSEAVKSYPGVSDWAYFNSFNPLYEVADAYYSCKFDGFSHQSGLSSATVWTKFGVKFSDNKAVGKLADCTTSCPCQLSACSDGLTVSLWVNVPTQTAYNQNGTILVINDIISVGINEKKYFVTIQTDSYVCDGVTVGQVTNFAFTYRNNQVVTYINGGVKENTKVTQIALKTTIANIDVGSYNGNIFVGSIKTVTAAELEISDIAIWNRKLHDFECNRFFGFTAEQLTMIKESTLYWTSDPWVNAGLTKLCSLFGRCGTSSVYQLKERSPSGAANYELDRWGKSRNPVINKNPKHVFVLGNGVHETPTRDSISLAEKCITDTYTCVIPPHPGLTVSIWLIIRSVSDRKEQIYVNSGSSSETDADSRGISIYTNSEKLLVTRATYEKIYSIRTDSDTYKVGEWINLGLTWSPVPGVGCKLYLNGIDYNIMIRNGIASSTTSQVDRSPHLMVGVFDEYAVFEGKPDQTLREVADMTFGDVTYFNQSLDINEYRRRTGLVNANRYYLLAVHRWEGHTLIDIPYTDLRFAKKNSLKIGPEGHVDWNSQVRSAQLHNSRLILSYLQNSCPGDLSMCTDGLSIGGWFKLKEDISNQSCTFFKMGNAEDNGYAFALELIGGTTMSAWVKSGGSMWIATTKSVVFRKNQWQFYGFSWGSTNGISIFHNGMKITRYENKTTTTYTSASSSSARAMTIGEIYNTTVVKRTPIQMEVFNLVIYNYTLETQQQSKMVGIKGNKLKLFEKADIYYTFSGLYSTIQTPQPILHNTLYSNDKYEASNAAVCTQVGQSSYIDLGDVSTTCLVDTSLCTSLILTMNVRIFNESTNQAVILSSGGRAVGFKGLTVIYMGDGSVNFTMRNATHKAAVNASVTVGKWIQLQVLWFKSKGLQVKVDGEDKAQVMESHIYTETNAGNGGNLVVGRHSDGQEIQPSQKICVSDVMVRFFSSDADVEEEANNMVVLSCYQNTDFQFRLRGKDPDRNNRNLASKIQAHNVSISNFQDKCLSDPSKCAAGVTLSMWVKLDSGSSGVLFTTGAPTDRGITLTVSADEGGTKYSINGTVLDGTSRWTTKAGGAITKSTWTNVGVTWRQSSGLYIFVDGVAKARGNTPHPDGKAADSNGDLFIGRENKGTASTLTGGVSDFVVWYGIMAICGYPSTSRYRLEGSCTLPSSLNEPTACNLQSNCRESLGEFCLDGTKANLLSTSRLPIKLRSTQTIEKYFQDVVNVVQTDDSPTLMAKVQAITNANKNWIIKNKVTSGSQEMRALDQIVKAIDSVIAPDVKHYWESETDNITKTVISDMLDATENLGINLAEHIDDCTSIKKQGQYMELYSKSVQMSLCGTASEKIALEGSNAVEVPAAAFGKSSTSKVFLTVQQFNHLQDYFPLTVTPDVQTDNTDNKTIDFMINTRIVNVAVSPPASGKYSASESIKLRLKNIIANAKQQSQIGSSSPNGLSQPTAVVFWDKTLGMFSDLGCTITHQSETEINATCNHMTSFAALMQPIPPDNNALNRLLLTILSYTGSVLSLVSLLLFIIIILAKKELTGERYMIHLNLCVAFFIAQLGFMLTAAFKNNVNSCRAIGVLMHLFFVAGFAWLLVEALFAFYAVTAGVIEGRLKFYLPLAWGIPVIIVGTTAGIDISAYGHGDLCWLTMNNYFIWAFLGPVLALCFVTVLVCSIVACNIGTPAIKKAMIVDQLRSHTKSTASVMPFMVIAWAMGAALMIMPSIPIQYIFVIFNAPQGFWIFLCFGLMNPEVKAILCRRKRNTIADSQQWENAHKANIPTFHSTDSNSPPPTYRSTRSLVSSHGSEMDYPQSSGIQNAGFYTQPPKTPETDIGGTFKYHA